MLVAAVIFLLVFTVYILLNFTNKFTYVIAMYFFSISAMILLSVLYVSKTSFYAFSFQSDYTMYMWLSQLKIHISDITRILNFCTAMFMTSSIVFYHKMERMRIYQWVILIVPIIAFLIYNDSSVTRSLYILENATAKKSALMGIIPIMKICNRFILQFYMLLPVVHIVKYFVKTKIPLKKEYAIVSALCLGLIDGFIYVTFITGTFKHIMFNNVGIARLPVLNATKDYITPIGYMAVLLLCTIIMLLFFKPFNSHSIIRKKEMAKSNGLINQNISMMLHVYKNAFIALANRIEFVKMDMDKENYEKLRGDVSIAEDIMQEYILMINKHLGLLRNIEVKYGPVNVLGALKHACEKINLTNVVLPAEEKYSQIEIYGDVMHLTEVFVNILVNSNEAIEKKGAGDGKIEIKIYAEQDMVMIEIKDNGCGIKQGELKNVFKPFNSTKARISGGGVGLAYVDNVIRKHHGDIRLKSKEGEFTIMQITLARFVEKSDLALKNRKGLII